MKSDSTQLAAGRAARRCSASDFQREYLGILPQVTDRMRWLIELATEYHTKTEAYDCTVCTGPVRDGGIMPATSQQHSLINCHAQAVHRELFGKARDLGFTADEWRKALRRALRQT